MFGIINYKLFILSGILLNITPGADTLYILGRGISQGRKSAIVSALGISAGCLVHTILAAFGLSAILQKSILAFNIIKLVGALYLIYLGIKSIKNKELTFENIENSKEISLKKVFLEGVITNVLNPKVALFFLSFLPQFISSNNSYGFIPFLILGFTFIITGTLWGLVLSFSSSFITDIMKKYKNIATQLNKITGIVFVALGIKLLNAKNK